MKTKFFMALPIVLLALSLGGWFFMVRLALDDPTFAVEPAYYEKAAKFDQRALLIEQSRRLGWQVTVTEFSRAADQGALLRLSLRDAVGRPIEGARFELEALSNLRAADVQTPQLTETSPGSYEGRWERGWPGIWELRARVVAQGTEFVTTLRAELPAGRAI